MIQPLGQRLHQFTTALLERQGALVDWADPDADGMALLPPEVARTLECAETLALTSQPTLGRAALRANLATDFLDRVGPLLGPVPSLAAFRVPDPYLKKAGFEESVPRTYTWLNAKVTVCGVLPVPVAYETWYFLATLQSEEPWEELVRVDLNTASGVEVHLPDAGQIVGLEPYDDGDVTQLPGRCAAAARHAGRAVQTAAQAFLARLGGRHERDRQRLRSYYLALLRQDRQRRVRAEPGADAQKTRERAVKLELQRKLDELEERYALRATLAPLGVVRLTVRVLAIQCQVQRKQARALHRVYWNPLLKQLEPLACFACGGNTFAAAFSDDRVEPLCPACAAGPGHEGPGCGTPAAPSK